jgi:uncharacterized phiE125 gp8 family phage protein
MADLTTLANIKQWLKISDSTNDALLTRLVTASSEFIKTWLNRDIFSQTYVGVVDGFGGYRKVLENYPITAVSSVVVDQLPVPLSINGNNGYTFNKWRVALIGYRFNRGVSNVVISYTAGYAVVPPDLEQACIELCALRYRELDRIGLISKGLAGETITFTQKDFTNSVRTSLMQHKRVISL